MEKEERCGQFPSHLRHTPLPSMPHDSNGLMTAAVSTVIQSGDPLLKCGCLCECSYSTACIYECRVSSNALMQI